MLLSFSDITEGTLYITDKGVLPFGNSYLRASVYDNTPMATSLPRSGY